MKRMHKRTTYFFILWVIICLPFPVLSQSTLSGKIIYEKDQKPAANATVGLSSGSDSAMADRNGMFTLHIKNPASTDTVIISSVGYEKKRILLSKAMRMQEYELKEIVKDLESVTVFSRQQTVGNISEKVGYYRSWDMQHTGGEIGRIFRMPYDAFIIDKIRFKAGNTCDTCLLKLHIREVVNGIPGDELIEKEITTRVNRLSLDDKVSEFDLTPYKITFYEDEIFVSIEVLRCTKAGKEFCAFSFAGTEKGENIYKTKENSKWTSTNGDSIYLKLFFRY